MNGFGRAGAYIALFSEIGFILLITTLAGVLAGKWADDRLGTLPLFAMTGFLMGMSAGWIAIYRLITRFLGRFD